MYDVCTRRDPHRRVHTSSDQPVFLSSCLSHLLQGSAPDLRDVLFIRTTVLRNLDIYAPLNLSSHIKEANYDVREGAGGGLGSRGSQRNHGTK